MRHDAKDANTVDRCSGVGWSVMTDARDTFLLIDNFDSFTYNLVQYLGEIGVPADVYRNDALSAEEAIGLKPRAIVLSPGPGRPDDAGICLELVRLAAAERIPLLGVCLGHQAIGQAFGLTIIQCEDIVHGKSSMIHHDGTGIFRNLASPFPAARYHSLIVSTGTLPDELSVSAWLEDGTPMALNHRHLPIFGVQFHPESIATEVGHDVLRHFADTARGVVS